jgi:DNA-binding NarL/FixJ family response regulator
LVVLVLVCIPTEDGWERAQKPKIKDLENVFENITEIPKRNKAILKAYQQGYSQHMIAKVLGMAQSTINGIVKRMSR